MKTLKEDKYIEKLKKREINPTAIRLLILKAMVEYPQAFSLTNLENVLDSVDKSTLSRTISLFHKNLLIHSIDDGSGSMKYSVCSNDCNCTLEQLHAHFYCYGCKKTLCLENIHIPKVNLPEKFDLESINFVLKGHCNNCSHHI